MGRGSIIRPGPPGPIKPAFPLKYHRHTLGSCRFCLFELTTSIGVGRLKGPALQAWYPCACMYKDPSGVRKAASKGRSDCGLDAWSGLRSFSASLFSACSCTEAELEGSRQQRDLKAWCDGQSFLSQIGFRHGGGHEGPQFFRRIYGRRIGYPCCSSSILTRASDSATSNVSLRRYDSRQRRSV
jgi:hypothetical protein